MLYHCGMAPKETLLKLKKWICYLNLKNKEIWHSICWIQIVPSAFRCA